MSAISLATLRRLVRERADMVDSDFIADDSTGLDRWINEGCAILHEKLVTAYGDEYIESALDFAVTTGQEDQTLAVRAMKLYEVDYRSGSGTGPTRTLLRYSRGNRNSHRNTIDGELPAYKLSGPTTLRLLPAPSSAGRIYIKYAPEFTDLSADSDTVNFPNKWEKYVVVYAAIQALEKEESPTAALEAKLEKWDRDLKEIAENRDLNQPLQTVDVYAESDPTWDL